MTFFSSIQYMLYGIIAVTILDIAGAIASRKLNFQYAYLVPLSLAVYTIIAYFASKEFGLKSALITNAVIGLYDGTIGVRLSLAFKLKTPLSEEDLQQLATPGATLINVILAVIFGWVGHFIATL